MSSSETVSHINLLSSFLAYADFEPKAESQVDAVILLGNSVLATTENAFRRLQNNISKRLLIAGGKGHATPYLRQAILAHPRYKSMKTEDKTEAELLGQIAKQFWNLSHVEILLEDQSTNCGENASFSKKVCDAAGWDLKTAWLVQDPAMQRRSDATFRKAWAGLPTQFMNWQCLVPKLEWNGEKLKFTGTGAAPWPMDRFLELSLGEVPRLRDEAGGYGPKGQNFIAHVDIPANIESAQKYLQEQFRTNG